MKTGLACCDVEDIGLHYARTLRLWHRKWIEQEAAVRALGHDSAFFRKWRFYFSYCEAGFEQQFIHCCHIVWVKAPVSLARGTGGVRVETGAIVLAWCFLAGLATGKFFAALWMVPLFASAAFALAALVSAAAPAFPAYRLLDPAGAALFCSSAVSCAFSCTAVVLWTRCWLAGSFADLAAPPDAACQVPPTVDPAMSRESL